MSYESGEGLSFPKVETIPHPSLLFAFNPDYPPELIQSARRLIEQPPKPKNVEVIKNLMGVAEKAYRIIEPKKPTVDWDNLESDPVFQASLSLSLTLIFSLHQLKNFWADLVLDRLGLAEQLGIDVQKRLEALQKGSRRRDLEEFALGNRRIFCYLTASEICRNQGINLERDLLSPLKALEMSLDYDPHLPNLLSRSASTRLPFNLRAFHGRLRFAQQARAHDSVLTALSQELQLVALTMAHYTKLIREELENGLGIELSHDPKGGLCLAPETTPPEIEAVRKVIKDSPVLQIMLAIAQKDYNFGQEITDPGSKKINNVNDLFPRLYRLAISMIDPAINEALLRFPNVEDATLRDIQVPPTKFYHYYQALLGLRVVDEELFS